jgi:uncharacterized short protein YbdD (DUF466 family)
MPVQYNPQTIDFSALAGIGQNIGGALGQHNLGTAMKDAMTNGVPDYNKMVAVLQERRPDMAAKMAMTRDSNSSMLDFMKFDLAKQEAASRDKARSRPSPTDRKAGYDAQDEVVGLESTLKNFKEAADLLDKGVYEGYGAGITADIGTKLPGGASGWLGEQGVIDTGKAQRTQDYLSILEPQAMKFMAEQLKGSTAVQEMQAFTRIYSDPNTPNATKAGLLRRLIEQTEKTLETKKGRAAVIGGGSGGGSAVEVDDGGSVWDANGKEYTIVNGQPVPVEQ